MHAQLRRTPAPNRSSVLGKHFHVLFPIAVADYRAHSMEQGKELMCSLCNAPVTRAAPVGPPMADDRVPHLRCWIRTRQAVTDHGSQQQRRGRRSRRWQRRSRRKRVILITGCVVVAALAILTALAFERLLDLAMKISP